MKTDLTDIREERTIPTAGQTDAGAAGEYPARDHRTKATNRRGDGRTPAVPFNTHNPRFRAFQCLKKLPAEGRNTHLTGKAFCPIPVEPIHIQQKAFYGVIFGCGLREGEAINLLWNGINIDFEKNRITLINRPGTKDIPPFRLKDHESRSIPMPNYVVNLLLQVQEQAEPDCPFVFLDKARWEMAKAKWRRFQQEGIERKWDSKQLHGRLLAQFKRQCRMAGIKTVDKLTVHSMRKSWACNLADNSVPIHTLMKLGGWGSIETCQQYYLQSTDENEKKAIEGLEKMVRG